jgi:hypothetical protein
VADCASTLAVQNGATRRVPREPLMPNITFP